MREIIISILLFLSVFSLSQAQPVLLQKDADAKTLVYYNASRWDELIGYGETALENGVDFFNLRLRLGISYYKKSDYMSAIPHLEKALSFNRSDVGAMEYLYYSYLFSGRESDVLSAIYDMPVSLKNKLGTGNKIVYGVYAEGGITTNQDLNKQKFKGHNSFSQIYNEQEISKDGTYISVNLKHQIGKHIKIFHGYNNITVNRLEQILDEGAGMKEYELNTTQNEYYISVNFNLGDGFNLAPAFHFSRVNYNDVDLSYDRSVNPWRPVFVEVSTKITDFALLLSLTKNTSRFKFGFKNSVSNMNKSTQVQNTAQVMYFPSGNLNLYTITEATHLANMEWGKEFKSSGILDQSIGFKVFDHLWVEGGYAFGNIFNYVESDAYIIFNNVNKFSNRITVNLIAPVTKNLEFSIRYQHFNEEVPTTYFSTPQEINTILTKNSNHKIIGGIKWTF